MLHRLAIALCLMLTIVSSGIAEERLPLKLEDRAQALFTELRCVVCQNQSISDSDADVARDLRAIVREQIQAGRSDVEVRSFLVARYGEFILLKPVFSWHTAILWLAPLALLIGAGVLIYTFGRRHSRTTTQPLSDEEEREISRLLK